MNISDIAIRRPVFTTMITVGLISLGWLGFQRLDTDLYPDVTMPLVSVAVPYPGASPEDVEREVIKPLEEAVVAINDVDYVQSASRDNVGNLFIVFKLAADFNRAASDVRDKVAAIRGKLPDDIEEPVIQKFDIAAAPVLVYTAQAPMPSDQVRDVVEDLIKPTLEQVPGVARVDVVGGREREVHVELDPVRMASLRLTPANVVKKLKEANATVPAGHYTRDGREVAVRTLGQFETVEDVRNTVLFAGPDGSQVRVRDVADVTDSFKEQRSLVRANAKEAVAFQVVKASKSNTVRVADGVKAKLAQLQPSLPKGVETSLLIDQSIYINANAHEVEIAIFFGGAMAILVILFFMRDLRSTFISALALPTAVIGTFLMMWWLNFSLNMVTLLALSLAIGLLVDDAVVVRENIFRHLEHGEDPLVAASKGTQEIALAVFATTMTICAVFVPVAFMSGMVGQFFKQFGLTITCAVLLSMFVAFTLDPMLSARLAKQLKPGEKHESSGLFSGISRGLGWVFDKQDRAYASMLRWAINHRLIVVIVAVASLYGSVKLASLVGGEFVAPEDRGQFVAMLEFPSDTSLEETSKRSLEIERELNADPRFKLVFATLGPDGDVYKAKYRIDLGPKTERKESVWQMQEVAREICKHARGAKVTIAQPPPMEGAPEGDNPIMLTIQGPSYDVLVPTAMKVAEAMRKIPGATDVNIKHTAPKEEMRVMVDRPLAAQHGLPMSTIGLSLRTALDGEIAGALRGKNFRGEEDQTDIRVRFSERDRKDADVLARLPLTAQANPVLLGDVARIVSGKGETQILRLDRVRQITVTAAASGRPMGSVVEDVNKLLPQLLPEGYHGKWMGMVRDMNDSNAAFALAFGVAALFIYIVLASQFESFIHPVTIMISLPLAMIGAFLGLYLIGAAISLGSQIGIILLMGLVTKNAILLVDSAIQFQREGMSAKEAMLAAGPRRLRPILMTTAAMVLGMLPTAMGQGLGSEFRSPMATAVIGGVISSTFLTLLVVPVVYLSIEGFRQRSRKLMAWMFRLESRPDPVLARRDSKAPPRDSKAPPSDRAAAAE
ncbi:MAG TPA: efflux RND transporter permease subunit [Polyangiales bacterium]|nr:efflux RND transporter permease subunit [Polyangiales bacterium]